LLSRFARKLVNKYKKTLTLAGARGKPSSRYHPVLSVPHDTNLNKCEAAPYFAAHTLAFNGATRHSLLPSLRVSTCNLEVIFNAGAALASHLRQLSGAVRDVYSSSSMFFALDTRAIKNPCISGAIASSLSPLISRKSSAGIGTLSCNFAGRVVGLQRAVSLHLS
jgi:hypothetical protein